MGGRHLRERYGADVDTDHTRHDVKAAGRASEERVLVVIGESCPDHAVYAEESGDVPADGDTVTADADVPTVAFVVGHDVKLGDRTDEADRMRAGLEDETRRVIESRSPCVHWDALARGPLDGVVCFYPDDEEQVGELLAAEAGASAARPADGLCVTTTGETRGELVATIE